MQAGAFSDSQFSAIKPLLTVTQQIKPNQTKIKPD
jgi:hypothetical protein